MTIRELFLVYIIVFILIHLNIVKTDFENKERHRRAKERKALNNRARRVINEL